MTLALKEFESLYSELTDEFTGSLPEYEPIRAMYLEQVQSRIYSCNIFFADAHLSVANYYLRVAIGLIPVFKPDPKKLQAALYRFQAARDQARVAAPLSNTAMAATFGMIKTYDLLGERDRTLEMIGVLEQEYPEHPYRDEVEKIKFGSRWPLAA
jgi:hypothetical protein